MKPRNYLVWTLFTLGMAGCKEPPEPAPPPPEVDVAPVTQADVPIYHEWIGSWMGW